MNLRAMNATSHFRTHHLPIGRRWSIVVAALPLVLLPAAVWMFGAAWPAWKVMVATAVSVFAGLKWLTLVDYLRRRSDADMSAVSLVRAAGYLCLWPGMNAAPFFAPAAAVERPRAMEWYAALAKFICGAVVVAYGSYVVAVSPIAESYYVGGAIGVAGLLLVFHFGLFHVLSLAWRRRGVAAMPIMDAPLVATSLGRFWGRQWNLAFRDLAHRFVFRPALARFGPAGATWLVFLFSGVVHDVVISLPVRAGYGLPTLYFLIQGAGVLMERSRFARQLGIGRGVIGWTYCLAFTLLPIALLFHRPFLERAIAPMLAAMMAYWP